MDDPPLVRYFLLSRAWSPARVLAITRAHWSIENQLHWVLDVVFDEDHARNRRDNGPENLAILRKLALNILRSHPNRASIRHKSSTLAGTTPSFALCSPKCDSPALKGEGKDYSASGWFSGRARSKAGSAKQAASTATILANFSSGTFNRRAL